MVTSETWETDTCDSPFTKTPTEPGEMSVKNVEEKDEQIKKSINEYAHRKKKIVLELFWCMRSLDTVKTRD